MACFLQSFSITWAFDIFCRPSTFFAGAHVFDFIEISPISPISPDIFGELADGVFKNPQSFQYVTIWHTLCINPMRTPNAGVKQMRI